MKRTLIIGDVHGCIDELEALLHLCKADPARDNLLFIGDVINKGPDSRAVFDLFLELQASSLMGNHEYALLQQAAGKWKKTSIYKNMSAAFGKTLHDVLDHVHSWPYFIETEAFTAVHAGLEPDRHPANTDPDILMTIRTWDGTGKDLNNPKNPPWFELYTQPKPVVFGHWAAMGRVDRENAIGLDTGCAYGGALSAVAFPGREYFSVPAKKQYCSISAP